MNRILLFAIITIFLLACKNEEQSKTMTDTVPHIVFVTGDEEYRSEESMPMLAKILKRETDAKIDICYAVDSLGFIDPNRSDHIEGLSVLEDADLMVLFTRFRALPLEEAKYILDFAESGKPMVGFRTSTHAFFYEEDSSMMHLNNDWPASVFGQQWIVHHGHFDDGHGKLTSVRKAQDQHPILNGVDGFDAYSWLYHVDGGDWKLKGDCNVLLEGKSLKSKQEMAGKLDQFPLTNPVAWTKTYRGANAEKDARVFFTTLGHPYDFKEESMRKLALNGIYWALGKEDDIPVSGVPARFVDVYNPNNSGFGKKYKLGRRPTQVH